MPQAAIDRLIINPPYQEPRHAWRYDRDTRLFGLGTAAESLDVQPEDLARAGVTDLLRQPDEDFERAAELVLQKNEELCRRLAEGC